MWEMNTSKRNVCVRVSAGRNSVCQELTKICFSSKQIDSWSRFSFRKQVTSIWKSRITHELTRAIGLLQIFTIRVCNQFLFLENKDYMSVCLYYLKGLSWLCVCPSGSHLSELQLKSGISARDSAIQILHAFLLSCFASLLQKWRRGATTISVVF